MADCRDYRRISRDTFDRMKAELRNRGITPPEGDRGTAETMGVSATFEYNEPAATLRVCIERKPFYMPSSTIWGVIDGAIRPFLSA